MQKFGITPDLINLNENRPKDEFTDDDLERMPADFKFKSYFTRNFKNVFFCEQDLKTNKEQSPFEQDGKRVEVFQVK